jgi:hypothetical protein
MVPAGGDFRPWPPADAGRDSEPDPIETLAVIAP